MSMTTVPLDEALVHIQRVRDTTAPAPAHVGARAGNKPCNCAKRRSGPGRAGGTK